MIKLLTVFGAIGQQGGSLIDYIPKTPELFKLYHIRGITRDTSKSSAVALTELVVEAVEADLDSLQYLAQLSQDRMPFLALRIVSYSFPFC